MADCLYAWYSSQTKACLLQKITIYLLTLHVLWKQSKLLLGKFRRFTVLQNCNAFWEKKRCRYLQPVQFSLYYVISCIQVLIVFAGKSVIIFSSRFFLNICHKLAFWLLIITKDTDLLLFPAISFAFYICHSICRTWYDKYSKTITLWLWYRPPYNRIIVNEYEYNCSICTRQLY